MVDQRLIDIASFVHRRNTVLDDNRCIYTDFGCLNIDLSFKTTAITVPEMMTMRLIAPTEFRESHDV